MLTLSLLIGLSCYSQENYDSENYRVTLDDIKSTTFKKDTTANALVIYERGNSYVDRTDYDLRTEVQHKIKILKREGFDKANVAIYLYNNQNRSEKINKIVATTYNLVDGEVVKTSLSEQNIFWEKYDENRTIVKFTLPNIQEGSVITYSYTLTSPFMFNYKGWNFQDDIPKLHSEYEASIPGNWQYNTKLVGDKTLFKNESKIDKDCLIAFNGGKASCAHSIYVMKDIPAFIDEDYMTTKMNYLARVEYELKTFMDFKGYKNDYTKTWKTVDSELRADPNIGKQLGRSIQINALLTADILNETDVLKKAIAIYEYVQETYTWNEKYNIFKDVSVKDLIKNKSGNVSSINILLHNLLEETGIDVKPILLSTRNNGFATKIFPVISEFNYLIVQATIDNNTYLLDATDKYLSFGEIPFRCLNHYGRLLDFKKGSYWIDIAPKNISQVLYNATINLDKNNKLIGKISGKTTGYHALNLKKSYYPNKEAYVENLENKYLNSEITNHEVSTDGKTTSNFSETYNIELNTEVIDDHIYLNPFIIKFFTQNPFKLQERTYPIDFGYKDSYFYMLNINLGDTYSVREVPQDFIVILPDNSGRVTLSSQINENSISLSMKIDFKEAIYPSEYYPYLKEFMNKIVDVQKNATIVLKKI